MIPVIILTVLAFFGVLGLLSLRRLFYICAPNEVLIFSGSTRRLRGENRRYGYVIVKGGSRFRVPMLERVDKMDLTNMVIDVGATNAYSKGGIPLTVQGVANVKIAGNEPVLNNAIERFLGKSREEIMRIAKATLEGSLRGVLASLTPEEVNEDKLKFAERLVHEVEQDMTALGLVVDTLKIQNVHDEVKYLDSIGRKKSAEILSTARMAEAKAKADSMVRAAENLQRETKAQIDAQTSIAKADAQRRLTDAQTRRAALVAEELATVAAQVAQSKAEVGVQKARVEQVRKMLEADVVQPAKASSEAAEAQAKGKTVQIVEDGRARAEALRRLAESYRKAGKGGRDVLLLQKLDSIIEAITDTIAETRIDKVTMIGSGTPGLGDGGGSLPVKAFSTLEQFRRLTGVDLVEKLRDADFGKKREAEVEAKAPVVVPEPLEGPQPEPPAPTPQPMPKRTPPKKWDIAPPPKLDG
ncbi:MAG: SPFH domain-containing protein [Fimbriimonadaceae bacterium]|nr:SPFH domain-containing protein [Fimbriimonadaceae bacterium]